MRKLNKIEKTCDECKNRGSMKCPPSIKCYATKDKPYFEPNEKTGFWCSVFKKNWLSLKVCA